MVRCMKFKCGLESLLALYKRCIETCRSIQINQLSPLSLQSLLFPFLPCTLLNFITVMTMSTDFIPVNTIANSNMFINH